MNKLTEAFKVFSYKLSQAEQEDRTNALKYLSKLDGAKIKMIVASMCEAYVNLEAGKISKDEAKGIMALIEKDLEEGVKND